MSQQTIAFFGATGGCAGSCLALALAAGYDAVALVRTPSKLASQLAARGVSHDVMAKHLTIVEGGVRDIRAVKETLNPNGQVVDKIISGIGGVPKTQMSFCHPLVLDEPTICQDAMDTILAALRDLSPKRLPLLTVVSSSGVHPELRRDYPVLGWPLWGWMIKPMLEDKRVMEHNIFSAAKAGGLFRGFIVVRPTHLVDGPRKGMGQIQQGWDGKPTIGYTIGRDDVGLWMFEKIVEARDHGAFLNQGVTLTY